MMELCVYILVAHVVAITTACNSFMQGDTILQVSEVSVAPTVRFNLIVDDHYQENSHRIIRRGYQPLAHPHGLRDDSCKNIRRGLETLQYGFNQYYFKSDAYDVQPSHTKLFDFSCPDELTFLHSGVPVQITNLSFTSNWELDVRQVEIFTADDEVKSLCYTGAHNTQIHNDYRRKGQIMVTALSSVAFTAEVTDNVVPGIDFFHHLSILRTPFKSYESEWLRFITEFGTHYTSSAKFGGSICIQTLHSNNKETSADVETHKLQINAKWTLNEVISLISSSRGKPLFNNVAVEGGIIDFNSPISAWITTISQYPSIVGGETKSIISLMEKLNVENQTLEAVRQAVEAEKDYQSLKAAYDILNCFESRQPLLNYICRIVRNEMRYVTPLVSVVNLVKDTVADVENLYNYQLLCKRQSDNGNGTMKTWITIPVMKGTCTTLEKNIYPIESCQWSLPPTFSCLYVFSGPNCTDKAFVTSNPQHIVAGVRRMSSIQLCRRR